MTPRTVVVSGTGGPSLTFTIPATVEFDPESVVASIEASGLGATTPELTIADSSGQVIAAKRQGESIPTGDTGLATWALRLTDEIAAGATSALPLGRYFGAAAAVASGVSATETWVFQDGTPLLDLTTPTVPTILADGVYAFSCELICEERAAVPGKFWRGGVSAPFLAGPSTKTLSLPFPVAAADAGDVGSVALVRHLSADDKIIVPITHNAGAPKTFSHATDVQQLA